MPTLNPFVRALFQSSVLSQALAAQNYVLLVPTTESLLYARDVDLNKPYSELCADEDFLGSHILRITPPDAGAKDGTVKETRGKAKTYSTVNGRTVIIKENMVYSNKGFKHLSQAQLLSDSLFYSPGVDAQQWLLVYISKPLTGTYEKLNISLPVIGATSVADAPATTQASSTDTQSLQPKKKDIQTFNDLLTHFPMIARQMQPGLERLFNEFGKELGRPLPPPPSRSPSQGSLDGTTQVSDDTSINSNGTIKLPFGSAQFFDDDEDLMRTALETAVTAAIDLFQGVDKQQLSFLGATTDLTGPAVERLIERYVAESVHDSLLFPRLCGLHRAADHDLDRRIRQMDCLDVAQVGIALEQGRAGKQELLSRISRGVTAFRKMGVAGSPQQMLDILLETQKVVSEPTGISDQEKRAAAMTINADILVSLLLVVVIRSQVRHLQARLSYMQRFIYIDDVESGEIGYALSTLEAVLAYLATDSGGLRKASKQNQLLWDAAKAGNIAMMREIYQGMSAALVIDDPEPPLVIRPTLSRTSTKSSIRSSLSVEVLPDAINHVSASDGNLSHVFPFQANGDIKLADKKAKKRVKMEARSMSISSSTSLLSRTATLESTLSGLEGDTSIESLAQTQDATGNSIAMMAVEAQKPESLRFLLSMPEHYPPDIIMDDTTSEGATLLSAAIQLSNTELIDIMLDYVENQTDPMSLKMYLAKQDSRGRSACHYLFNTPSLIAKLADQIPWRLKDKIGQTPLFSICRSYDHSNYHTMVSDALVAAKNGQGDGRALSLEDHTDNKGNTLLHILNDPIIMHRVLHHCDTNPNAMNDRKFTPLMLASKYGRVDMVRIFFGDPRVDLYLREARGLTAVELAKDDEVRNRIDDLTLFSETATSVSPDATGRLTAIVRSFFVEDGTTRYILKSGAPQSPTANTTYTITTSRRSLQDFSNLAKWLAIDHPSSYLPGLDPLGFRNPFQIHSRPSKAVLHDSQTQLDRFLKILITHPTFATHEVLWEFFLVPEMQPDTVEARTRLKAEVLRESIADDYEPLTAAADLADIESVIAHSRDIVKRVSISTRTTIRRGHALAQETTDIADATTLASTILVALGPPSTSLPKSHTQAFAAYAALLHSEPASSPLNAYLGALHSFIYTLTGIQTALSRPLALISQIRTAQRSLEKHRSSLSSQAAPRKGLGPFNINLPGMEESRQRGLKETEQRIIETEVEIEERGKSLRYGQEVVLAELAGWTSWREGWGRAEIKRYARGVVVRERERLRNMQKLLDRLAKENASNVS